MYIFIKKNKKSFATKKNLPNECINEMTFYEKIGYEKKIRRKKFYDLSATKKKFDEKNGNHDFGLQKEDDRRATNYSINHLTSAFPTKTIC